MTGDPGSRWAEIGGHQVPTGHLIDGRRCGGGEPIAVYSPIDGGLLGEIPDGGPAEINAAVAAASNAFPAWADLGPAGRGVILDRFADLLDKHAHRLAEVGTAENGALIAAHRPSSGRSRAALNISFFADLARSLRQNVIVGAVVDDHVRYEPAGVAALIVPWNAPLMLGTWKIGPALAAGDTVVLKPPEWAPFALSLVGDIGLDAGIPPGVLNIVQGSGTRAGAALTAHRGVSRISFTGSPETARMIAAASAPNLVPLSFELGGKSPMVVLPDADLRAAAEHIIGQFTNAGQVCLATTRLLLHESIAEQLLDRVCELLPSVVVGDPRAPETTVGPLIHPAHFDKVNGFVQRAIAQGARPLLGRGGPHERGGLYYQPTVLTGVEQDWEIVQKEVFGPVLTVQTFSDVPEAIDLANGTKYGLAAAVYGADSTQVDMVAKAIVAGTVWVNCYYQRQLASPFGGSRLSGVGRDGGQWSFDFFCDVKNVSVRRDSLCGDSSSPMSLPDASEALTLTPENSAR